MNYIIIPVSVGIGMTAACLESLVNQDIDGGVTLVVIDNGSHDGVGHYLRSLHDIVLMSYAKPRSLNYVWNRSLRWVFESQAQDHVLVVNNDTVLHPATYRLLLADGGQFVTAVGQDRPVMLDDVDEAKLKSRPHPDFSCFMMRRAVWETVGMFDESFWVYSSDGDMHLRMHRMGIDAISLNVPFYHIASGTLKQTDDATREFICRKSDQDREMFIKKWGCAVGSPEYYSMFER